MPAERGRILDRNGLVLAENRPQYNVVVYLEDLRQSIRQIEYTNHLVKEYLRQHPGATPEAASGWPSRTGWKRITAW